MTHLLRAGLAIGLSGSLGCATMFSGAKQSIQVSASPADAEILVDGTLRQPGQHDLARSRAHIIEARKPGYRTQRVQIRQGFNGLTLLNLLWGPFLWIGFVVDGASGSIHELGPDAVSLSLEPAPNAPVSAPVAQRPPAAPAPAPAPSAPPAPQPSTTSRAQQALREVPGRNGGRIARTPATPAQQSWVLAVMPTQSSSRKLKGDVLSALSDQIRVFLAERRLKVIDRGTQESAMKEVIQAEKKRSYAACVDASCQVPLGKALAASHILRTSVTRFGNLCTTNGELVDLTTEVTAAAASARSGCGPEALLGAAEELSERIVTGSR